jgi:hypothetical protein
VTIPDETKISYTKNQQVNLEQAVIWFKKSTTQLIEEIAVGIGNSKDIPIHWLPQFLRKAVAKDMLTDLIARLETNVFDNEAARQKMFEALKKGASVKSIEASVNIMVATIRRLAFQELAQQPAILEIVLNKTDYIATLIKANLGAALIEYEKSKVAKR